MRSEPNESEYEEFRKFAAKISNMQKQLSDSYHGDNYLRYRLMGAVDVPILKKSLRERLSKTSQEVINNISNQLNERPRTSGSSSEILTKRHGIKRDIEDDGYYSLGREYGGRAQKPLR